MADAVNAAIDIASACQNGAVELAAAWQRAFEIAVQFEPGSPAEMPVPIPPAKLATPGLLVHLSGQQQQCWLAVPANEALFAPWWFAQVDDDGECKLAVLAEELGTLLLGAGDTPAKTTAQAVENLLESLVDHLRGCTRLMTLPCVISPQGGEDSMEAFLAWSATPETTEDASGLPAADSQAASSTDPAGRQGTDGPADAAAGDSLTARADQAADAGEHLQPGNTVPHAEPAVDWASGQPTATANVPPAAPLAAAAPRSLPPYSRNLLKIRVPVSVTLARKRQRASQVLELCPGAIIQFERSCEEALDLEVGEHRIAMGEAVKVGDKFGLRITEMVRSDERFTPVRRTN